MKLTIDITKCSQCPYFRSGYGDTPNTCTHGSAPNRNYYKQMILEAWHAEQNPYNSIYSRCPLKKQNEYTQEYLKSQELWKDFKK